MPASLKHLTHIKKSTINSSLFAKWPADRLYYTVELVKLDPAKKESALVRFEDGTVHWANLSEMHIQMNDTNDDLNDIICCMCEDGKSESPNEIIVCDTCQLGYHQNCHKPEIESSHIEQEDEEWNCATCVYIIDQSKVKKSKKTPKMFASTPKAQRDAHKVRAELSKKAKSKGTKSKAVSKNRAPIKLPKKTAQATSSEAPAAAGNNEADNPVNNNAAIDSDSDTDSGKFFQQLDNGQTVEKAEPVLVNVAKALSGEKPMNGVVTEDFVSVLIPESKQDSPKPDSEPEKPPTQQTKSSSQPVPSSSQPETLKPVVQTKATKIQKPSSQPKTNGVADKALKPTTSQTNDLKKKTGADDKKKGRVVKKTSRKATPPVPA